MSIHSYQNAKGQTLYRVTIRIDGKQVTTRGIKTKNDAKKEEVAMLRDRDNEIKRVDKSMTLGAYLDYWLDNVRSIRKMGDSRHQRLNQHIANIKPVLGHKKVIHLEPSDVAVTLRSELKPRLANLTIKQLESMLKGAINDTVNQTPLYLPFNPLGQLTVNQLEAKDKTEIYPFQPHEQRTLMEVAKKYADNRNDQRWFIRPYLALHTGLRSGEIAGLRWKDINLNTGKVYITRAVNYSKGDTKPTLGFPKTKASVRDFKLNQRIINELKSYRAWQAEKLLKGGERLKPDDHVLMDDDLGPLHRSSARKRWDTLLKVAKLPHRGIHHLRHTHASNLIKAKAPIKEVQEKLGHSSIIITMDLYVHIYEEDKDANMEAISDNIFDNIFSDSAGNV